MEPVRLEIAPEVNLDYVRSDKFKTGTLSVQLITPINEKTASFGALLPSVLRRGTMSHPDMRSLSTALDLLYGSPPPRPRAPRRSSSNCRNAGERMRRWKFMQQNTTKKAMNRPMSSICRLPEKTSLR